MANVSDSEHDTVTEIAIGPRVESLTNIPLHAVISNYSSWAISRFLIAAKGCHNSPRIEPDEPSERNKTQCQCQIKHRESWQTGSISWRRQEACAHYADCFMITRGSGRMCSRLIQH